MGFWGPPPDFGDPPHSPTGEKFRSKIELSRFLGPSRDLGNFDFKHGLELSGPPKVRGRVPQNWGGQKSEYPEKKKLEEEH